MQLFKGNQEQVESIYVSKTLQSII